MPLLRLALTTVVILAPCLVHAQRPAGLDYTLRVDASDTTGIEVTLRIRNAPGAMVLAAHAHPEYDDKYWRYVVNLRATDARGSARRVSRIDSTRWQVAAGSGDLVVAYRVAFPSEPVPRASWRPFLTPTGGLVGGPHSFLYVVGREDAAATVTLDMPRRWRVATGLDGADTARVFRAATVHALMESPMLIGELRIWPFHARGVGPDVTHRVAYWPKPDATPFDTVAFVGSLERLTNEAITLFGAVPYRHYTFLLQDGAYSGGLEHPNSVTLGAQSSDLARDPNFHLEDSAHEFLHTWNLMAIKPIEYRGVDFRVQRPVPTLWFSEGLTIYYADLLRRRAGLPVDDSSRVAHLEGLIDRYLSMPGHARFSAEQISNVEYNAPQDTLGDYVVSPHLMGEVLGTMLDFIVRDATDGARTMDDVMRRMYTRFRTRGFTGGDIETAVNDICSCRSKALFAESVRQAGPIAFNRYLAPVGLRFDTVRTTATDPNGQPSRDLRMVAWRDERENALRLRIMHPASVWARSGLHTGDRLVSIDGKPIGVWPELRAFLGGFAIGQSARFVVQRAGKPVELTVTMAGFERPVARVVPIAAPSERQLRLRDAWMRGR